MFVWFRKKYLQLLRPSIQKGSISCWKEDIKVRLFPFHPHSCGVLATCATAHIALTWSSSYYLRNRHNEPIQPITMKLTIAAEIVPAALLLGSSGLLSLPSCSRNFMKESSPSKPCFLRFVGNLDLSRLGSLGSFRIFSWRLWWVFIFLGHIRTRSGLSLASRYVL